MTLTQEQYDALNAPLSRENVLTRSQAGMNLSYIESWWAISEANRIFGFDGWNRETIEMILISEEKNAKGNHVITYRAKTRVTVGECVREGYGTGTGISKDIGQAHESAIKEAESDSGKRSLMTFGNQFGLALYDKKQRNVVSERALQPTKDEHGLSIKRDGTIKKTELQQKIRDLIADIGACSDPTELQALLNENIKVINAAEQYDIWYSPTPENNHRGLKYEIETRQAQLGGYDPDREFAEVAAG